MSIFGQDLRYGMRMLWKNPGFTAVVIITLALGIAANTAIFSVVNAVLLRPLPYRESERLMMIRGTNLARGMTDAGVSMPDYREWVNRSRVFESMAAFSTDSFNISSNQEPERVTGTVATIDLLRVLEVVPAQGRAFLPEEGQFGKHHVVIVSDGLWRQRFGAETRLSDQTIKLNGEVFGIIGVMPPGFEFPDPKVALWMPLALPDKSPYDTRGNYWLSVVARLKDGVTKTQAQVEMDNIHRQLQQEIKETAGWGASVVSLQEAMVGSVQTSLLILLGAVGFVLLITCANVANLLLARSALRQKEIAIRTTLGASRLRLVWQLLTESMLLGLIGGASGLLLAVWGVDVLVSLGPDLPRLGEINVDARVLVFTLALSLLTSLLFGLVPALKASRSDVNETLKEAGRGTTSGTRSYRVRNALVVIEIALSLVLLVSAGLMVNSLLRLQRVNPGFRTENILTMQLSLSPAQYPEKRPELTANFYQQVIERLRALPGVKSVGMTTALPLTESGWGKLLTIEDRPTPKAIEEVPNIQYRQISSDYFDTLGIALTRGRYPSERDTRTTTPIALVNETMARRFWPDENPIGKRFYLGPPEEMIPSGALPPGYRFIRWTIVGIVRDVKQRGLGKPVGPEVFTLQEQGFNNDGPARNMYFAIRTTVDPALLAPAVRSQIQAIDKEQPIAEVASMEKLLADSLSQIRFSTLLLTIFALVALVLAAVGVYGVVSYTVTQRTHEIGIRMALGAQTSDVMSIVLGQGMRFAVIGVALGVAASYVLTRLMKSLLFGVTATDPTTFASIALALMIVALLACYLPARRATKVDPMVALRYE